MRINRISSEVLDQFKYDEVNGGVMRVMGKGVGNPVPKIKGNGYIYYTVYIDSVRTECAAHRMVYLLHNPDMDQSLQIDHINGTTTDNRIENLRSVTCQQNHFNRSTALGFFWDKREHKFRSHICADGKVMHLGYYDNILDARAAYLRGKKKYHIIEER